MFGGGFVLGRLFGFPIRISWSFLLLLGFVLLAMGGVAGVAVVLLAFVSVLLHELGHALMARHLGVRIKEIELHFFGGAAKMMDLPRSPGDEIAIAAAGPAVSFALAGAALALGAATHMPIITLVGKINLLVGLFNLLPALPMDGGRILRAALSLRMGFLPATEIAAKVARVFAVAMALFGLIYGPITLLFLSVLLWIMTSVELHVARFRAMQQAGGLPAFFQFGNIRMGGFGGRAWPDGNGGGAGDAAFPSIHPWDVPCRRQPPPGPPVDPPGGGEPVEAEYLPPETPGRRHDRRADVDVPPPVGPDGNLGRGVRRVVIVRGF